MNGGEDVEEDLIEVGEYIERFNELTGQEIPCGPIYQSHGLAIHVKNHHPGEESVLDHIEEVIEQPDYVGKHPKEENSVELVKQIDGNIMVCIKLDVRNGYLFVASMFKISNGKLNNRIHSGRLKPY